MKKESLPILLEDGSAVTEGMDIYRVVEGRMFNPGYYYGNDKKATKTRFPTWSGGVRHTVCKDEVIRIVEGFNARTIVIQSSNGTERTYSVRAASTHDTTEYLFSTRKGAIAYIKSEASKDVSIIRSKIDKSKADIAKYTKCLKQLKSNLTGVK
jgi:hypothetical protein